MCSVLISVQSSARRSVEGLAMERCIKADAFARRRFVDITPGIQEGIRARQSQTVIRDLRPLAIDQLAADVANMTKTDIGRPREIRDTPWAIRISQEHSENLG